MPPHRRTLSAVVFIFQPTIDILVNSTFGDEAGDLFRWRRGEVEQPAMIVNLIFQFKPESERTYLWARMFSLLRKHLPQVSQKWRLDMWHRSWMVRLYGLENDLAHHRQS